MKKTILFVVLLLAISSTALAATFHFPETKMKISNYTSLDNSELVVEFAWWAENGWGGDIKGKEGRYFLEVADDGTYTIPEIKASAFSIWDVNFDTTMYIKDKYGNTIKTFYAYQSELQHIALLSIEESNFIIEPLFGMYADYHAILEVECKSDPWTDGFVKIKGDMSSNSIFFSSAILAVPFKGVEKDLQFDYILEIISNDVFNQQPLYIDKTFVNGYQGDIKASISENSVKIPLDLDRLIELDLSVIDEPDEDDTENCHEVCHEQKVGCNTETVCETLCE